LGLKDLTSFGSSWKEERTMKKRFTDQQIAYALRLAEQGTRVTEICRKMGVSEPTFYG
jgi:AcrR family transcriptional regulator